jgi:hypothetical protein
VRATRPDVELEQALQVNLGQPIGGPQLLDPTHLEPPPYRHERIDDRPENAFDPAHERAIRTLRYLASPFDCEVALEFARHEAMDGNGGVLASTIKDCGRRFAHTYSWRSVLAVLPYVVHDRGELRAAVRETSTGTNALMRLYEHSAWPPIDLALIAATQRDLMRVSGNPDLAARWQDIVNRHARVLADAHRRDALVLW